MESTVEPSEIEASFDDAASPEVVDNSDTGEDFAARAKSLIELFPELSEEDAMKAVDAVMKIADIKPPRLVRAPEMYADRPERRESIVEFLNRVYCPWLDGSMTRADLRKLDVQASVALVNYESKRKTSVPLDTLNLPTVWQKRRIEVRSRKENESNIAELDVV